MRLHSLPHTEDTEHLPEFTLVAVPKVFTTEHTESTEDNHMIFLRNTVAGDIALFGLCVLCALYGESVPRAEPVNRNETPVGQNY